MAAVAAEPRAARAPSTVGDGAELDPEPAPAPAPEGVQPESERATKCSSVTDLVPSDWGEGAAQERRLLRLRAEERDRPGARAAGKALATAAGSAGAPCPGQDEAEAAPSCQQLRDAASHTAEPRLSAGAPDEVGPDAPLAFSAQPGSGWGSEPLASCLTAESAVAADCVPSGTEAPEAGGGRAASQSAPPEPALQSGRLHRAAHSEADDVPNSSEAVPFLRGSSPLWTGRDKWSAANGSRGDSPAKRAPCAAPQRTFGVDSMATESRPSGEAPRSEPAAMEREPDSVAQLVPGSEVRVCLDHIIDDALVVSFHLGQKVFSGVLMDLNKRFGPYGIPVTIFPKRDYRDKCDSMQLKTEPFQLEMEKGAVQDSSNIPSKEPEQTPELSSSSPNLWTSKPPPLFQEGVPYPPPLFIRDTYNQSIPQPPPRKIKRPKRRLYREEPTSIMNAIKLRPRQVLCDKCKSAVAGDKREVRRGPGSACGGEDAKRRRNDGMATAGKRPRSEEKGRGAEAPKRQAPVVGQVKGGAAGNRVVRGVSAVSTSTSRVQLSTKKVLQSKNVDHSKAREVLKMAKAQKRQRNTVTSSAHGKTTRASSLRDTHQKVHFTRRLHQISGSGGGGPGGGNPLPPRIRIKPQRYRNEENHPSTCKPAGAESVLAGVVEPNPPLSCCPSAQSSSSSAGEAATLVEIEGPALVLEPDPTPDSPSSSQARLELEPSPQPKTVEDHRDPWAVPEQQRGGVRRRGRPRKRGRKPGGATVCMSLNPNWPDSSNASIYSVDSADDLKSSNSECSSTETVVFAPPGVLQASSHPSPCAAAATSSPASKEGKKRNKSLKAKVFSKNVSKCITLDSRTVCVGDIVWAKICGFPWWPARILTITVSRRDSGLLITQEARVSWFGSPTTSCLPLSQLTPFLESFQTRFDKKRKGLYRKAIAEAAKAAKQLSPEVRGLLTQFET